MNRWTQNELNNTDDLSFAIKILYERRKGLNPYSPLYNKISHAVRTLTMIQEEKEKFIAKIVQDAVDAVNFEW